MGTLARAELWASGDDFVLVQSQSQDKSNAWKQTAEAFLWDLSWKYPEDTGTSDQEKMCHYESHETGWEDPAGSRDNW